MTIAIDIICGWKEGSKHARRSRRQFDIRLDEIGFMAKELGINNQNFIDLVICKLSTDNYIKSRMEILDNVLKILKKV